MHSGVQQIMCCVFVFLRLVYRMLPVSLDCPLLIAPSIFSNVYLHIEAGVHKRLLCLFPTVNIIDNEYAGLCKEW